MKPTQKIWLVALAGAVMAICFMITAASNLRFLSHQLGVLMTLWTVMPYVILYAGRYFFQRRDIQKQWLHFAVFEVLIVAWIYWQTLFMYPDAQGSLIFLFLPLIQAVLNVLIGLIFYWQQHRLNMNGVHDE